MRRLLFAVAIAIACGHVHASALSDAAATLQPGQWRVLGTANLNRATLDDGAGYHVLYYTEDLTWDPVSRQLLFVGGGHDTDAEFLRYRESTNAWTRTKPAGSQWHDNFSHAYDHNAIAPALGKFYFRQPAYDPSNYLEIYDITSNTWSRSAPMPYRPGCCGGLEYFPELNGLVLANGDAGLLFYDPAANRWSEISGAGWGDYHNFAEYSPVHKVMIFGGAESSGTNAVFRLNASRQIARLSNAPAHMGTTHSIVTTDPVSGNFLVFFDNAFYELNPATDTWRRMSANAPWQSSGGVFGVVATPISTYGVVAFVEYAGDSSKVYLYRHTAAASSPTVSLSASPTSVSAGGTSRLTWSSSNANACTASGAWSGSRSTSGTEQRTVSANATFTLTCSNAQGQRASRSVTVTVAAVPPAPTLTFTAWPTRIGPGDNTGLTWSSQNTTGCVASGGWAGNKASSGKQVSTLLYASTAFNLDCTGPGGTISRSVSVTVDPNIAPRPLVTMSLSPWTVTLTPEYCAARGMTAANCTASTVITWSTTNATSCTASEGWSGTKPTSGRATLSGIAATRIYHLSCTGPGGSRNAAVKFTVIHP
jgi:hypothetical protein